MAISDQVPFLTFARRLPRYGRAALRALRTNAGRAPAPWKLTWAVTYWCQYRCTTCNIWQKQPQDELRPDEVLALIERNPSPSWLDVTGGEIFLRRDIGELLGAALDRWRHLVVLHFATNGYKTNDIVSTVEGLLGRSPAHLVITVSLDGWEELNDRIRGIPGGYRHQLETFRALRALPGVQTVFGMTLSHGNVGQLEETIRRVGADCPGVSARDFHLNVMQLSDHYYDNRDTVPLLPPRRAARREIERYRELRGRAHGPAAVLENRYLDHLIRFLDSGQTPMRCHSLRASAFIDPWGTVYPCITWDAPLGNLRDHELRLAPIWNAVPTRERQAEIWQGRCPQCWTACEAYQSIAGNLLRRAAPAPSAKITAGKSDVFPA